MAKPNFRRSCIGTSPRYRQCVSCRSVLTQLLFAWGLLAICVACHAIAVTLALRRLIHTTPRRFWRWTRMFVLVAWWMILVHLIEITIWALFYVWQRAMPDVQSALYFSAVTYTTTGYGDVVLPAHWRLLGAIEALTGILMCGWSTGFFFAVVGRFYVVESRAIS